MSLSVLRRRARSHATVLCAVLMNDPPAARKRGAGMSLNEARYLQKLMAKHADDCAAMARDIKLNYDQKTPAQLKKRIAVYRLVYGAPAAPIVLQVAQPKGSLPYRFHDPRPVAELAPAKRRKIGSRGALSATEPASE